MEQARAIQSQIRGYLNSRSSNLVPVPEIQNDDPAEAIHKLQVQIFALSDALTQVVGHVDKLTTEVDRLSRAARRR